MNEEEKQTIERIKRDYELAKSEDAIDIDIFTEDIKTVLNLLEKKDKIIDLMAIAISNEPLPTEEYCIFRNFDCPEVGGNRDCKECVKQYFERKVENG